MKKTLVLMITGIMIVGASTLFGETLFVVGNSLSRHEPRAAVGWKFNHGMAATSPEHDYVHLLLGEIATATGKQYELFITRMKDEQSMGGLTPQRPKTADIIIFQVGDNYQNKLPPTELTRRYTAILKEFKQNYPKAILVAVSTWHPYPPGKLMRQCAEQEGVLWADISTLGLRPEMQAKSEGHFSNPAVNWHPGDKGMAAIANAIWKILSPALSHVPAHS